MKSNWKLSLLLAGQQGNTQRIKSIQSIRDHAPRVRVGNRKVSVPRLVYLMKAKAQLAASRSKKCTTPTSPTPIDHITWDGMSEVSAVLSLLVLSSLLSFLITIAVRAYGCANEFLKELGK